jgi:hypothetical protein
MLPPELEAQMASDQADGVLYRRERNRGVTGIVWRPGDRNALAAAIIDHVGAEPMPLDLDGMKFEIRRMP